MIKNEKQYKSAKKSYKGLIKKIPEWEKKKEESLNSQIQYDIFVGQAEELKQEIDEYEGLVSGKIKTIEINSIREFPEAIVKYRIMNNVSYEKLSEITGLSKKNVINYEVEQASDCYGKISLERVVQIIDAIGGDIFIKLGKKK